jgi:hypothetical protein
LTYLTPARSAQAAAMLLRRHPKIFRIRPMPATRTTKAAASAAASDLLDDSADQPAPVSCADALGRTANETCRQHERLSRLNNLHVQRQELTAAHALVDTCDLALAECVATFEKTAGQGKISDDSDVQAKANALYLAAREYLRRHWIAEKASQQLKQHDVEKLNDLQMEYEFMASALLQLRQATVAFGHIRPDAK